MLDGDCTSTDARRVEKFDGYSIGQVVYQLYQQRKIHTAIV